jgi:urocanate hydratase
MGGVARRSWARNPNSIETCIEYNQMRSGRDQYHSAFYPG